MSARSSLTLLCHYILELCRASVPILRVLWSTMWRALSLSRLPCTKQLPLCCMVVITDLQYTSIVISVQSSPLSTLPIVLITRTTFHSDMLLRICPSALNSVEMLRAEVHASILINKYIPSIIIKPVLLSISMCWYHQQ